MKTELNDSVESETLLNDKENINANCASPVDEQNVDTKVSNLHMFPNIVELENVECAASPVDVKKEPQVGQELCLKVAANLACEWSTKKTICSQAVATKGAISKTMPPPPQAYLVKDIYQRNREEAERRRSIGRGT